MSRSDPLKDVLEKHLRSGKSGIEETPEGKVFLTVHVPSPKLVITGAVHISQALAPMGQLLGYDVTIVDPRTAFASIERFPDVKVIAEWPDVALPPIGIDRYTAFVALTHDPKIDDPGLDARAEERLLLHRRARLAENPRPPRRAAEGRARLHRQRHRPHPFADRPRHRRGVAGRDRGRDHGRDHRSGSRQTEAAMKFGPVPPREALGATAVHTIRQGALVLKKGTLIGPAEVAALEAAGIKDIVVARLEPGDVSEDEAAAEIAKAVAGQGVQVDRAFTGRANLFAEAGRRAGGGQGRRSTGSTASTRRSRSRRCRRSSRWCAGEMIATVKIIPFAVGEAALQGGAGGRQASRSSASRPTRSRRSAWSRPCCRGSPAKVVDKTLRITQERLAPAGADDRRRAPRAARAGRAREGDRRSAEGGRRTGRGVRRLRHRRPPRRDPGGGRGDRRADRAFRHAGRSRQSDADRAGARASPMLGAPGCARSPKENGFDWVLMRLLAGLAGVARRHHRHGRRRAADGDRDTAAAARRAGQGRRPAHRRGHPRRRPLDPHGRAEQAPGRDRRPAAGADRRRGGAGLARAAGDRGDRTSARQGRGGARTGSMSSCVHNPDFADGLSTSRARPGSPPCPTTSMARSSVSATCRR